uniref:Uncharacterized protein n=1 Tax=Rousettus aegyptiacus TaxID=9407 RepID=A0A7J8FI87_ROUAE|nr:hypothetical protein HJG63_011848 [Rousettus aegyptiacus]
MSPLFSFVTSSLTESRGPGRPRGACGSPRGRPATDTRVLRSCDRGARHPIRHMLPALLRRRAGPRDGVGVWGAGTGPRQGPQGPGWDWNEKPGPGARNAHNSEVNSRSHQLSNSVWRVHRYVNTTGRGA